MPIPTINESRDMITPTMHHVLWIKQRRTGGPKPHLTGPENQKACDQLDSELSYLGCRTVGYKSRGGVIALALPETTATKLVEKKLERLGYVIHGEGRILLMPFSALLEYARKRVLQGSS